MQSRTSSCSIRSLGDADLDKGNREFLAAPPSFSNASCAAAIAEPFAVGLAALSAFGIAHESAPLATFAVSRSDETRTTSQTRPAFSRPLMIRAEMSSCHQRSPWVAEVGKAWWLLW